MSAAWKGANKFNNPGVLRRFWMRSPTWAQGGMGAAGARAAWGAGHGL